MRREGSLLKPSCRQGSDLNPPSLFWHTSADVKGICSPSPLSPAGVFRLVHAVWSSRKQDSQRLCYFNCIQNYLCIMKGAVKQSCVRTWSSPMSSYPGIHTERKNSHVLPTIKIKEFSGSLWVSAVPQLWGCWQLCRKSLNPSNPPEIRILKSVLWGAVPGYSALWLFVAD